MQKLKTILLALCSVFLLGVAATDSLLMTQHDSACVLPGVERTVFAQPDAQPGQALSGDGFGYFSASYLYNNLFCRIDGQNNISIGGTNGAVSQAQLFRILFARPPVIVQAERKPVLTATFSDYVEERHPVVYYIYALRKIRI